MELRPNSKDKAPVLAAVVALLILGVGSVFLTWQNIRRQRELVDQHLLLSAGAVIHGVDANLMRAMHSVSRAGDMNARLIPTIKDVFQEFTASGEIVFLGIFDEAGQLIVSSTKDEAAENISLPEEIIAELEVTGRWAGPLSYHGKTALFSALRANPRFARTCSDVVQGLPVQPPSVTPPELRQPRFGREFGRGMGMGLGRMRREMDMGPGMGPGMGRGMAPGMGQNAGRGLPFTPGIALPPMPDLAPPGARTPEVPSMFLVAALSPDRHLAQFTEYRNAALLQTGYVLVAATVLWFLALAYLSRRTQALKAARLERFQSKLLDNMPDGLLTLDGQGAILSANPSAARHLLGPEGEAAGLAEGLVGRNFRDFPFAELAATDGTRADQWRQYEHDGRLLEVLSLPLAPAAPPCPGGVCGDDDGGGGEERLVLLRDRTGIRRLEDDLAEAKRLAAIGSLAAGVAHEIRNPLSSLRGFAQLFANKLKGQEPLSSYACTMVQEADRLNRVVTDLLYLARPREIDPTPVDLPALGESLMGLLRFDLERKGVTPRFEFTEKAVCADEDALKQALLNLLVNALDALPDPEDGAPGQLTISSSPSAGPEPGVWVSVADNGQGMDEEVRQQAFEPFFTAKRQGTGLGLAIVQGIMRAHRGRALIESEPGKGTTLRLFFPDCPGKREQPTPEQTGGEQ